MLNIKRFTSGRDFVCVAVSKPTQADNTLTRHEEDLQPDTTPLVQAQKLLHYFFHFISLNFLSRENPPVDFQARLLPTIFTGCSKTCFDFFKQWKPKVKNDFCDTFAAAQQITKCKQTGKILTKAVSCDTDHIRHMKQILSYSRFYSGPVAHGGVSNKRATLKYGGQDNNKTYFLTTNLFNPCYASLGLYSSSRIAHCPRRGSVSSTWEQRSSGDCS